MKVIVQNNSLLLRKPTVFLQQNFGHSSSKAIKLVGQSFIKNVNLGNIAAVKNLEGTLVVAQYVQYGNTSISRLLNNEALKSDITYGKLQKSNRPVYCSSCSSIARQLQNRNCNPLAYAEYCKVPVPDRPVARGGQAPPVKFLAPLSNSLPLSPPLPIDSLPLSLYELIC